MDFFAAYVITIAVETAVMLLFLKKEKWQRVLAASALASSITLPVLWFALVPAFFSSGFSTRVPYIAALVLFEALVVVAEALVYLEAFPHLGWKRVLYFSFVANLASFLAGLLI